MAVIVFLIWKFEPSVPFLVAMIAAKDMKCASFPNLVLSTFMALMNVLVTFNAHLSLSDTFAIVSPSFLFFTPFCPVPHRLVLYFAIWFTFLCFYFVLMKSIWLAFILSRDVFVLTRIKTRVVFPWPPLLTPDEGPLLETLIFSCIVSSSERTFTFRVLLNTLPTLAMLIEMSAHKSFEMKAVLKTKSCHVAKSCHVGKSCHAAKICS